MAATGVIFTWSKPAREWFHWLIGSRISLSLIPIQNKELELVDRTIFLLLFNDKIMYTEIGKNIVGLQFHYSHIDNL